MAYLLMVKGGVSRVWRLLSAYPTGYRFSEQRDASGNDEGGLFMALGARRFVERFCHEERQSATQVSFIRDIKIR